MDLRLLIAMLIELVPIVQIARRRVEGIRLGPLGVISDLCNSEEHVSIRVEDLVDRVCEGCLAGDDHLRTDSIPLVREHARSDDRRAVNLPCAERSSRQLMGKKWRS